ncbi:hypothetical protein J3D56_004374 [Erwinia persicina]|jgi:hypothetical protein|nr:hypothetical protein [Erwinia persicina]
MHITLFHALALVTNISALEKRALCDLRVQIYVPSMWNEQASELHTMGIRGYVFIWQPG